MISKVCLRNSALRHSLTPFSLLPQQSRYFSKYFEELDRQAIREFRMYHMNSKAYKAAMDVWKVPLEKKAMKRARKEANPPAIQEPEGDLLVVHDQE